MRTLAVTLSTLALALLYACHAPMANAATAPLQQLPTIASDWSDADTGRQVYLTALLYADYAQTRSISLYPKAWERNPMLGLHPSDRRISRYFIGAALLSYGAARTLPAGWPRQSFQCGVIALQIAAIVHNKRMGLSFRY